jgi:hypothetical protein
VSVDAQANAIIGISNMQAARNAVQTARCNELKQAGSWTHASSEREAPPATRGGTVRDGTYVLRAWRFYGTDESMVPFRPIRLTVVLHGGRYERILEDEYDGTTRESGLFKVQGDPWTQEASCSNASGIAVVGELSYTASPNELTWVVPTGTEQIEGREPRATFVEEVFTRR